jgi:hypothetical protein
MRSPRKSDKAVESQQHVPASAAVGTRGPIPTPAFGERVVGATAIASAAAVLIDNVVVGSVNSPPYGAPMKQVLAFHAHHPAAVAIAVGLEALNVPLLLVFLTGLHGLVGSRGGAGAQWSRLAVAAGASLSAVMGFYAVLWDGVVLSARDLAEPSPVLELAWRMHGASFAWSLPALGTTFIGAALATHASGLTPSWQRLLAVAGGGLLLIAGTANLAIADGSAILFVGVAGFAAWPVWLLVTGVRLVLMPRKVGAA